MPNYCFLCLVCNKRKTVFRPIEDFDLPETCECGKYMGRDLKEEHCAVRGDYNKPIVSDSMAFDAIDLEEHRRRFPDIEVVVDHARSARPVLRSFAQKKAYMKARRIADLNSFT